MNLCVVAHTHTRILCDSIPIFRVICIHKSSLDKYIRKYKWAKERPNEKICNTQKKIDSLIFVLTKGKIYAL